jgi:hypothetical protein
MTGKPLLFHQTAEQLRRVAARGGRALVFIRFGGRRPIWDSQGKLGLQGGNGGGGGLGGRRQRGNRGRRWRSGGAQAGTTVACAE